MTLVYVFLGLVAGWLALSALLLGLADLADRDRTEFAKGTGSRRLWVLCHFIGALIGGAIYVATGRSGTALVAVPAGWIIVELSYVLIVRRAVERRRPRGARLWLGTAATYGALTTAATILIFPMWISLVDALIKPGQFASQPPPLFPFTPQWNSFKVAWVDQNMGRYLLNSAVQTSLIVVGQVVTAVLAGYAFAILRFPFKRTLFVVFLATLMVPFEVTLATNLSTVQSWGLYNTYLGLSLPFAASGFGAFLMRQAFRGVPSELADAARLDGLGHLAFLRRVALPLVRPTVAAVGVISFETAWVQYLWPLLATKANGLLTVQIAVKQLAQANANITNLNATFAGLVIASVPLVFGLIVFQKQLIRGLTAGAVKG
jgi:sn-glycerol 3-phosphate transport system permease protein